MCGIAGFLSPGLSSDAATSRLEAMAGVIAHRGPDGSGAWFDAATGLGLAHRRLAIIDLSPAGAQPMVSASERFVTVYNGEIYNFEEIRRDLTSIGRAPDWRGHSDTEVMLAAFEAWGVRETLPRLNGMFALAVWDRQSRTLTLARDRFGEKPLFYGHMAGSLIFGSELKSLTTWPDFTKEVDREALCQFIRFSYVPAPRSIWRGIAKLSPSHFAEFNERGELTTLDAYWSLTDVATRNAANPLPEGPELVDLLEQKLLRAVGLRMMADVPLGAFLSGGIDSSAIVALMQAQSSRPVKTFTIGFGESNYNEADHAKAVAAHLGTEHHEMYVSPSDGLNIIPQLGRIWDEPFSDSSQIPTLLLSKMTRQHVTVSLSGDAGDELFGGYHRYLHAMSIWKRMQSMPYPLRRAAGRLATNHAVANSVGWVAGFLPGMRNLHLADRLPKVGQVLGEQDPLGLYRRLVSHADRPDEIVLGAAEPNPMSPGPAFADFRNTMMLQDSLNYLPNDILVKVDRASMAVSLESRVPFLDPDVAELAWRLPLTAKFSGGQGKHILRQVLYRHVPRQLIERPKMGFGVPIDSWLRGPLREWGEALLDESKLRQQAFFDPAPIRRMWVEHVSGRRRWHYHLWDYLMFQLWLEDQQAQAPGAGASDPVYALATAA